MPLQGGARHSEGSLLQLIGSVISHLDHIEDLAPGVEAMGRHYFGCVLERDDYDLVGQALIWTLARGLEDDFTDEIKLAWLDAYSLLACVMERSIRARFGQSMPATAARAASRRPLPRGRGAAA